MTSNITCRYAAHGKESEKETIGTDFAAENPEIAEESALVWSFMIFKKLFEPGITSYNLYLYVYARVLRIPPLIRPTKLSSTGFAGKSLKHSQDR